MKWLSIHVLLFGQQELKDQILLILAQVEKAGRGRIVTNAQLQAKDHKDVYVVGDNIFYIPEGEERPVPQMVENAEHSAPVVAHNIYRRY